MPTFAVVATRGAIVESRHRVAAAVVDGNGRLVAHSGDADLATFWRSAAKPFQLAPLIDDGGIDAFGLDDQMLALACGSHNAEPVHREVGARWLAAVGLDEAMLACGGHPSLSPRVAAEMIRDGVEATPLWSNCSGKHAALLALARLNSWDTNGYHRLGHPVQDRVQASVSRWTSTPRDELVWGVDGCTVAAVALPLRAMALGYARLGTGSDVTLARIRDAMLAEPHMIAGTGRLDTELVQAWPGQVLVKIGAEGVYSAALPTLGLGVALKVEDGDMKAAGVALVHVLGDLAMRAGQEWPATALRGWIRPAIRNTRGEVTGHWETSGGLEFA